MPKFSNVKLVHLTQPGQVQLAYTVRYDVYVVEQSYAENVVTDEYVHEINNYSGI
jgi:predicted RNA-binding protein with PUA domain